jgi:trimeric autotransporter adhesin
MRFPSTIRLLAAVLLAFAFTARAIASNNAGDRPSLCCPSDLDGDGVVDSSDLADMLSAWGPASAGDAADLDASGEIDAIDIAILIGSWGGCPAPCLKTLVIGSVQLADGTPVADAVIVTELGGQGVSDAAGAFSFEVELLSATESLTVTAIASLEGTTFTGTKLVSPITLDGVTDAGVISITASTGCAGEFGWLPGFGLPGLNGTVHAMAVFDDGLGGGPALYVGGVLSAASGAFANNIARWDGNNWSSLGVGDASGVNGRVLALTVFEDGNGPTLFVGGEFTTAGGISANRIAKWNGVAWAPVGSGPSNGTSHSVRAMTLFDDSSGDGPALYVGGDFTLAGGVIVNRIARWNGVTWSSLANGASIGVNGSVSAMAVFDDGSGGGPALYVGGTFTQAGGIPSNRIAKWNGSSWSSLGMGAANGTNGAVAALAVFDDGSGGGPKLYVGGSFTLAGTSPVNRLATWDGASWSALDGDIVSVNNDSVSALAVFDDGSGSALYASRTLTDADGRAVKGIAKWDGATWLIFETQGAIVGPLVNNIHALAVVDDPAGCGAVLLAGGRFATVDGVAAGNLARLAHGTWTSVGAGLANGVYGEIYAFTLFDDGAGRGPELYAGGYFLSAGDVAASRIVKWNGTSWSPVGTVSSNEWYTGVFALTVFDDGSGAGPALYAGGAFTAIDGVATSGVAKWDGRSWSTLGEGTTNGVNWVVLALQSFDDGSGPCLYVGGKFSQAGGAPASRVAKWNGANWSPLGTGTANGVSGGMNTAVYALTVFDDGSGPALYVGGDFTLAAGVPANRIARWNGASWSSLGSGAANGVGDLLGWVHAMTVFDDGSGNGTSLYLGGRFATAGGESVNRVAKWNGDTWSRLGDGEANGVSGDVWALAVFDDGLGDGPALYVGGWFATAGGIPASAIARWNGATWSSLGIGPTNGVTGGVTAISPFQSGLGGVPSLMVGGDFFTAGGIPSHCIAQWGCIETSADKR